MIRLLATVLTLAFLSLACTNDARVETGAGNTDQRMGATSTTVPAATVTVVPATEAPGNFRCPEDSEAEEALFYGPHVAAVWFPYATEHELTWCTDGLPVDRNSARALLPTESLAGLAFDTAIGVRITRIVGGDWVSAIAIPPGADRLIDLGSEPALFAEDDLDQACIEAVPIRVRGTDGCIADDIIIWLDRTTMYRFRASAELGLSVDDQLAWLESWQQPNGLAD